MKSGVVIAVLLAFLASGSPALAQRWGDGETLDRILPQIRAHHPGRLSDAEPFVGEDGDTHYRIKWMTPEGRIIYFDADGRSGRWTNSRGGNEGGSRAYPGEDGPPRDYDRGGRQNWGDDGGGGRPYQDGGGGRSYPGGGGRGWPDQGWSGDRGRPEGGAGRPYPEEGGRPFPNGGRGRDGDGGGWNGRGGRWNGGGSHHHDGN